MGRELDDLVAEALRLSKDARAAFAKRLLDSLDQPTADEVGQGWVREAELRYAALKAGTARTIPSADVFANFGSPTKR